MRYLPHTEKEIQEMLRTIGVRSIGQLFDSIPENLRLKNPMELPAALHEVELRHLLRNLSRENAHGEDWAYFLGGGSYAHYIPSAVSQLLLRGEFLTAYTPYQPEVSQGTLQAIYEYQTVAAEILGMEIANASNYDGSTAMAEAVLMALRLQKGSKVLIADSLHPEYRAVLQTYLKNQPATVQEIPHTSAGGLDRNALRSMLDQETACVVVGLPNFFGVVEDFSDIAEEIHRKESLLITVSPEPLTFGLFKSPGEMGADIAVAEGQGFGNPVSFGGPYLGMFATRKSFVRAIPGRLVGETVDESGKRGFVLTLATREQHIRRERATSNICTNVSLCALASVMTLSLWGKAGFKRLSQMNYQRTENLKERLRKIKGFTLPFSATTFNEFVLKSERPVEPILAELKKQKIFGGIPLSRWYPRLSDSLLVCLTEMTSDEQVDHLVSALEEQSHG